MCSGLAFEINFRYRQVMHGKKPKILWLDCIGGLVVGTVVLIFASLLSDWEGLPKTTVQFMAIANLAYGSYSFYVTTRRQRPLSLVTILSVANIVWLPVCIVIVALFANQITGLGMLHLLGEGLYVAGLGVVEWRMRETLATT